MGCVSSSPEIEDTSRPVFQVWNIDEHGNHVNAGRIQVTDSELILRQKGKAPVVWPLRSLRRYGFDSELFSFECGRRCPTGPGIYAFKCRRAEMLFNLLQECLQNSASGSEGPVAEGANDDQGTATVDGSTNALVLSETAEGGASSAEVQPAEPVSSPTSPLYTANSSQRRRAPGRAPTPLPRCCTIGTCIKASSLHYMNEEAFHHATCGTCRSCSLNMCVVQPYVNQAAVAENVSRAELGGNVLDATGHPRQCVHCCCSLVPSSQSPCSADSCPVHCTNCVDQVTNYARLDDLLKQERSGKKPDRHFYMNVAPGMARSKSASWRSLPHCSKSSSAAKHCPRRSSSHFYANVSCHSDRSSDQQVNYIMLDLEQNESGAAAASPPSSPFHTPEGYATIDFDKTAALTNSANPGMLEDDSVRKTRHNGSISNTPPAV